MTPANRVVKILCVSRAYGAHAGGMERLNYEMIEALRGDPRLEVTVIANPGSRRRGFWFVITCVPAVVHAARHSDLIHLGDPVLSLAGWLVKKIYHVPVAVTVHGLDISHPHWLLQTYLRLFFHHLDHYLAISTSVLAELRKRPLTGTTELLLPATNDTWYNPSLTRAELAAWLQRDLQHLVVLGTVGRLVPRKGHAWFIEQVLPALPANVVYVVAGAGKEHQHLVDLVGQRSWQQRVLLLGRISSTQLQLFYNTIDAFIQPNIAIPGDMEGFGLVLTEAALCARPVFAAALDGIPDAIQNNRNGTLLPSGKPAAWVAALTTFINNPSGVSPSGTAARAYTQQKFTWAAVAPTYRQLFLSWVKFP